MAAGFQAKDSATLNQQLKVQQLRIMGSDPQMYVISGGNLFVLVREQVIKIVRASVYVDGTNTNTNYAQANLTICDSTALTAGGDKGAIEITGVSALAANDVVSVDYVCFE